MDIGNRVRAWTGLRQSVGPFAAPMRWAGCLAIAGMLASLALPVSGQDAERSGGPERAAHQLAEELVQKMRGVEETHGQLVALEPLRPDHFLDLDEHRRQEFHDLLMGSLRSEAAGSYDMMDQSRFESLSRPIGGDRRSGLVRSVPGDCPRGGRGDQHFLLRRTIPRGALHALLFGKLDGSIQTPGFGAAGVRDGMADGTGGPGHGHCVDRPGGGRAYAGVGPAWRGIDRGCRNRLGDKFVDISCGLSSGRGQRDSAGEARAACA